MLDFRRPPPDLAHIDRHLFGGFARCLYAVEKFQSDPERRLAVILDRDSSRWFRPVRGQFAIMYRIGGVHSEYQPDFVAEVASAILMLEPKARNEMDDPIVLAKKAAGEAWCARASEFAASHGGKAWRYSLVAHDRILDNATLAGLTA